MKTIDTKKTYSFGLNAINKEKEQLLIDKALIIRDLKNYVSKWICSNFVTFIDLSKFDMCKHFKNDNPLLSSQDFQHAIYDVYTKYDNKRDAFQDKIKVEVQESIQVTYYKRATKLNQVGDVKSFEVKMKPTTLSRTVTHLAKFYNLGIKDYMLKRLADNNLDENKIKWYNQILVHLNKYGDRLLNLALSIRENVVSKLIEHPIEFTSLTFSSLNQIKAPIVDFNKNKSSKYNVVITLGCMGEDKLKLEIPSKYSKKHHGSLKRYLKVKINKETKKEEVLTGFGTSYTIVFRNEKPVKIALCVDATETYQDDKVQAVGVDVNVKHNLFATSTGNTVDYDRKEFNEYVQFLKRLDVKKQRVKVQHGITQTLSKRDQRFQTNWKIRIKTSLKKKCSEMVDQIIAQGKDHLVIEDLGTFGASYFKSEEFEGFKYSRLVKLLNLSDLKVMLQSICNKKGVQLTLVQAHYTSQTCPVCGCISKENRSCQEEFKCVNCGHEDNADHNSSINIFNRFDADVLRRELLYQDKLGQFKPRMLKKEVIKQSVESYHNYP